jgi:hypothetical protein
MEGELEFAMMGLRISTLSWSRQDFAWPVQHILKTIFLLNKPI